MNRHNRQIERSRRADSSTDRQTPGTGPAAQLLSCARFLASAAAAARAYRLTQAILARAFRGELVPTEAELARREGRSYESADKLLERVGASNRIGIKA